MAAAGSSNRTVDRALDVLGIVARHSRDGIIFSDIARALEAPKSSLSPIIISLVNKGFLNYSRNEKKYFLGEALYSLGNLFVDGSDILALIEGILAQTVEELGYTSFFGVIAGDETRYLLRRISPSQAYQSASPQYALKVSCTGLGKALIIDYSRERMDELFSEGMPSVTANTITSVDILYKQILSFRAKDIVYEKEESTPGIQCRATPIRYNGRVIAAVSISFPASISSDEEYGRIERTLMSERTKIERLIENNPQKWIFSSLC